MKKEMKYKEAVSKTLKKFDKAEYDKNFSKENYKHYHLKISKKEVDIIKKIESQKNKNKYIIDLIRKDKK